MAFPFKGAHQSPPAPCLVSQFLGSRCRCPSRRWIGTCDSGHPPPSPPPTSFGWSGWGGCPFRPWPSTRGSKRGAVRGEWPGNTSLGLGGLGGNWGRGHRWGRGRDAAAVGWGRWGGPPEGARRGMGGSRAERAGQARGSVVRAPPAPCRAPGRSREKYTQCSLHTGLQCLLRRKSGSVVWESH